MSKLCGAKLRNGKRCRQKPLTGKNRCRLHGGVDNIGRPPIHGRYSKIENPRVKSFVEYLKQDSVPLELSEELSLARAYLMDYMNRLEENNEGVMRWHASFQENYIKAFDTWREQMIRVSEDGRWADMRPEELPKPPDPLDFVDKPRQLLDASDAIRWIEAISKIVERIEKIRLTRAITTETMQGVTTAMQQRMLDTLKNQLDDNTANTVGRAIINEWSRMRLDTVTGRVLN